jgi:Holliday junction resolvase YEN1
VAFPNVFPCSQQGLLGCGPKIAGALAAAGFGENLCASARTLGRKQFAQYLVRWRDDMRQFLETDPTNTLHSRHPALAASIPDTFPDIDVIRLYLYPLTSTSVEIQKLGLDQCPPDVTEVARLCELYFEWAVPTAIFDKFNKGFFQAVVMSVLREELVAREQAALDDRPLEQSAATIKEVCSCVCLPIDTALILLLSVVPIHCFK